MKIAIIDSCPASLGVYSQEISTATGAQVDCFENPMMYIATRVKSYDVIISEFYFEKVNLDFYWSYLDPHRLIILSSNSIDREIDCLVVLKKSSIHTKKNIISVIRMTAPSLTLVRPV